MKSVPPHDTAKDGVSVQLRRGCLALAALTLLLFSPTLGYDFVNFDDGAYVVRNEHVNSGLTWDNLVWAFTESHVGNWHPLTWVSHMLDCELFGLNPAGHHLTNLVVHAGAAVMAFLALHRLTGFLVRSWVVALLFAVHPLRVESVAWVSERKDVLSGLFFFAALWAYAGYVQRPGRGRYWLALGLFAGGLMSKSMLVTLPCLLLLLDFWPLQRWKNAASPWSGAWRLAREKIPFFLLSALASGFAVVTQELGGAMVSVQAVPLSFRAGNALVSCTTYLRRLVWPDDLAVFYPLWEHPTWKIGLAAGLLAGVSLAAVHYIRRAPWFFTGWFWYLGMLVPVIGLVQVGRQSMADRYTYLPSVGVTLLVVWAVAGYFGGRANGMVVLRSSAFIAAVSSMLATLTLLPAWRDSLSLFTHASVVVPGNYLAHLNTGHALDQLGRPDEAAAHYLRCVEIDPDQEEAQFNLGAWLMGRNEYERAKVHLDMALKLKPEKRQTYGLLGSTCIRLGRMQEAIQYYRRAIGLDPDYWQAYHDLGLVLMMTGNTTEAIANYQMALQKRPGSVETLAGLGFALVRAGRLDEAEASFRDAARRRPDHAQDYRGLALCQAARNQPGEAEKHFVQSLSLNPRDPVVHRELGALLLDHGQHARSLQHFRATVELAPQSAPGWERAAWVLATSPDTSLRDGAQAVRLAEHAVQLTGAGLAEPLDTLAAAYAESGRFPEAVATAERALELALAQNRTELAGQLRDRLKEYRNGRPWRMTAANP
jgi:protein O-mannosyl-transferase